jgi:hypothetical protein
MGLSRWLAWFKKGSGTFVRSTLRAVPAKVPDPFLNQVRFLRWLLLHRVTRYVTSWILAGIAMWLWTSHAWDNFIDLERPDGNFGHTAIDFGGQWIMGRMLLTGQAPYLYHRDRLRKTLSDAYPPWMDSARLESPDVDAIMGSFMGHDNEKAPATYASCLLPLGASDGLAAALLMGAGSAQYWQPAQMEEATRPSIRGPLYPPVDAFAYSPLALLPPQRAYRGMQIGLLLFVFASALGMRQLSRGRFWAPLAIILILAFPGYSGAQCLGQNTPITLTIVIWGWVLVAAGRPGWAGVVWGLLAFKPVWALAFFLVPLLTRRWRMCLAMIGTGTVLSVLTLPWVGLQAWLDWWAVGRAGAARYDVDRNWIHLSRDLLGVPRRYLLDFQAPELDPGSLQEAALLGWGMLASVLITTAMIAFWRRGAIRAVTGPAAAFLFLTAWLTCFHFMYYDALLAVLPVFLLLTEPREFLRPAWLRWEPLLLWHEPLLLPWRTVNAGGRVPPRRVSQGAVSFLALPAANYGWMANPLVLLVLATLILNELVFISWGWVSYDHPWETATLFPLWAWCGWLVLCQRVTKKAEPGYGALPITSLDVQAGG